MGDAGTVGLCGEGTFVGNPDNTMPAGTDGKTFTSGWHDQASSIGFINCP
ncbi:hypothetical protein SUDANB140_02848 [Streptomyces sp. enrichment culture]